MEKVWKPTKEENKELLDTPLGQLLNGLEKFMIDKKTEEFKMTLSSKEVKFVLIGTPIVKKRKSKSNNN
jgi:hypothetical protein